MTRPSILITRRWPKPIEDRLMERYDVHLNMDDQPMDRAALMDAMRRFDALCPTVSDRIDAEILGVTDRRVRIVASYGVGYEHIDLAAARDAGVIVTNTPDVLTDTTAELAVLLMLMVSRRAGEGEREIRAGRWTGWRPTHLMGSSLGGKTLGLVGFGRIAKATAQRAQAALGMKIAYFSRSPAPAADLGFDARFVPSLAQLVEEADVLSLHCPGGAETRHLINADTLARMKPGAILINTARGSVVDEAALADALAAGRIAGAGLDVFEREPQVAEKLLGLESVVLLPHLGSATIETRTAMGMRVAANLDSFFAGEEPPDRLR
jgi:lactate dehydrogenase-like 2-hydroxyacid dehydrogenase